MSKLRVIAVLMLSIGASVTLLTQGAPALDKPRTFSLLEIEGTFVPLGDWAASDRPPTGGDQFTTTSSLYRWSGPKGRGARVGRDRVLVTFLSGFGANFDRRATVLVTAQAYLPDGTLLIEGFGTIPPDAPAKVKLPVIGGTGVYVNARGYLVARNLRGGEGRSRLDFHLVP
jgi:hypothetical protein